MKGEYMPTWPKVVPKKCEWPSLASELTAADVRGDHNYSKGRLVACITLDNGSHQPVSPKKFNIVKLWLEGHPSGECADQIVYVKHKDGRKAYYNPDDDNEGCKWVDDFDAECRKCGSSLKDEDEHYCPIGGGGYCSNEDCGFHKKLQHE
jgi:hypothetical protein